VILGVSGLDAGATAVHHDDPFHGEFDCVAIVEEYREDENLLFGTI
jgi:hypothetical protein